MKAVLKNFPQGTKAGIIIAVSLWRAKFLKNEYFQAIIESLLNDIKDDIPIEFALSGLLQRHTVQLINLLTYGKQCDDAESVAMSLEHAWLKGGKDPISKKFNFQKHEGKINQIKSTRRTISHWDYYTRSPEYSSRRKLIDAYFESNFQFREKITKAVEAFKVELRKYFNEIDGSNLKKYTDNLVDNEAEVNRLCTEYFKEEMGVFLIWRKSGRPMIYPMEPIPGNSTGNSISQIIMDAVNLIPLENGEQPLNVINIEFVEEPKSDNKKNNISPPKGKQDSDNDQSSEEEAEAKAEAKDSLLSVASQIKAQLNELENFDNINEGSSYLALLSNIEAILHGEKIYKPIAQSDSVTLNINKPLTSLQAANQTELTFFGRRPVNKAVLSRLLKDNIKEIESLIGTMIDKNLSVKASVSHLTTFLKVKSMLRNAVLFNKMPTEMVEENQNSNLSSSPSSLSPLSVDSPLISPSISSSTLTVLQVPTVVISPPIQPTKTSSVSPPRQPLGTPLVHTRSSPASINSAAVRRDKNGEQSTSSPTLCRK